MSEGDGTDVCREWCWRWIIAGWRIWLFVLPNGWTVGVIVFVVETKKKRKKEKKNEHYYNARSYICLSNSIHQVIPVWTFVSSGVPLLFACVLCDDDDDDDVDDKRDSICILPLTCFKPGLSCCCCNCVWPCWIPMEDWWERWRDNKE